jgi:hypothetical protein
MLGTGGPRAVGHRRANPRRRDRGRGQETLMTKALDITLDETFHISDADLLFPNHR